MHTIIPGMVNEGWPAVMPFRCHGGHYQATGPMPISSPMCLILEWTFNRHPDGASLGLPMTGRCRWSRHTGAKLSDDLARRGHQVIGPTHRSVVVRPFGFDHARGILLGASDHRKRRMALGY